jgi:hypothetical protein
MRRAAWIATGVAGLIVGACSYPDFEFLEPGSSSSTAGVGPSSSSTGVGGRGGDGSGGRGGDGMGGTGPGGAGGAGGAGGSGGGGVVAIVPCVDAVTICEPGQVCCFDLMGTDDKCAAPRGCGLPADYGNLRCNSRADCNNGDLCCGTKPMSFFHDTECKPACMTPELTVCEPGVTDSCPGDATCTATLYDGYGTCP